MTIHSIFIYSLFCNELNLTLYFNVGVLNGPQIREPNRLDYLIGGQFKSGFKLIKSI